MKEVKELNGSLKGQTILIKMFVQQFKKKILLRKKITIESEYK